LYGIVKCMAYMSKLLRGNTLRKLYIILVFILFVKVTTEQQVARSLQNSSLKPLFKYGTGAKDLSANIIILVFVSGVVNLFLVLVF
jgi:hypothetical protein